MNSEKQSAPPDLAAVQACIQSACDGLLRQTTWNFQAHLGIHFASQYYLCLQWFGVEETTFSVTELQRRLYETQLPDGSWQQVPDPNLTSGELNATIFNYWALKASGGAEQALAQARVFILKNGGLEKSALFTKIFLALFGNLSWRELDYIPYFIFIEKLPLNYRTFSQWVSPHLLPIGYLRRNHVQKNLGSRFGLGELWQRPPKKVDQPAAGHLALNVLLDLPLIKKLLKQQRPHGSWGGYTLSTLLSMMCLDHFRQKNLIDVKVIDHAIERGLNVTESLYLAPERAYLGCLMDGHYWDTLLAGNALLDGGTPIQKIGATAEYLLASQDVSGGFPYGFDFEPDVDDTVQAVLFFRRFPQHQKEFHAAVRWVLNFQNKDGGYSTFAADKLGSHLLEFLARNYRDSVELFDKSCADTTGHALEALAAAGYTRHNLPHVGRAIRYLKKTQDTETGRWSGRWAVNTIFGTSCAIAGLVSVGEDPNESYLTKALDWLCSTQNADGGCGESTASYSDSARLGRGLSTPSQTAWVLRALCLAGRGRSPQAHAAANYLLKKFNSGWKDDSTTGTGHPGLLYMSYPSYAQVFPVQALSLYLRNPN